MQRYSQLFGKTNRESKNFESLNATLLQKAGFINQEMAGVYNFLPLGLRVLNKIENIVRKEMLKISNEVLLPSLSPKDYWETTKRIDKIDILMQTIGANDLSSKKNTSSYILNPTHEEIITPLVKEYISSYKDLPLALFQIQTKFRNEARAKSGLLRGREFRMKDLYSFHISLEDLEDYYEKVKQSYFNIFEELGLKDSTILVKASGGDFTKDYSDEFQIICENGEDIVFLDKKTNTYYNKEIAKKEIINDGIKVSEAGNIFILGEKFSKDFNFTLKDKNNKDINIFMGCYGIGTSRIMGIIAEKFNDDNGLIWPENISPYDYHIISQSEDLETETKKIIEQIEKKGKTVLWDDRTDIHMGEKLSDADLIGISKRIVISKRSLEKGGVEIKQRNSFDTKIMTFKEFANSI